MSAIKSVRLLLLRFRVCDARKRRASISVHEKPVYRQSYTEFGARVRSGQKIVDIMNLPKTPLTKFRGRYSRSVHYKQVHQIRVLPSKRASRGTRFFRFQKRDLL